MPQHLALGVVAAVAILATGLTFYFWRKSTGLYSLLVEGANRFEELRARNNQLELNVGRNEEKLKGHRESSVRLEKGLAEAREKAAELGRKLEAKEVEMNLKSDKLELQKSFLEKQFAKAQEQLRVSEEQRGSAQIEREELKQRQDRAATELDRAVHLAREEGRLRERELVSRLRDLEKTVENAKKTMEAVDPVEIKKVRRKIAQYDRLYTSMKGLREMTEERNRNYEVALRKLAAYVVVGRSGPGRLPDGIGPLVGRALEIVGAQLIDDNEPAPRGPKAEAGARFAASMDDTAPDTEHARLARETDAEAAALEAENEAERSS